jgi:hypothetical protein
METRKENQERVRYFKSNGSERSASPCHNEFPEFRFFCVLMLSKERRNKKLGEKGS